MLTFSSSRRPAALFFGLVFLSTLSPLSLSAEGEGGATVTITQESPTATLGTWTLLEPGEKETKISTDSHTFTGLAAGGYTLFIDAPAGMTTLVKVHEGSTELQSIPSPQASFTLTDSSALRIHISYELSEFGDLGVISTPPGIPFELLDPDGVRTKGLTPKSYLKMPVGDYTVWYFPQGCPEPPPKSAKLNRNKRASLEIKISCDTFVPVKEGEEISSSSSSISSSSSSSSSSRSIVRRSSVSSEPIVSSSSSSVESSLSSVSASVPAIALQADPEFRDVYMGTWYYDAVKKMSRLGTLQGYKDPYGKLIGKFGPENSVLISELAKIMQKTAKVETDFEAVPQNVRALNKWHSGYMAYAEKNGWSVYQDTFIDPDRKATRAEVVVTLLQALKIDIGAFTGNIFPDVKEGTPYAAAIEAAYARGFVSGKRAPDGSLIGFDPLAPVTRAEIAVILTRVLDMQEGV